MGKFIDETNSIPVYEWVGLRSKLYSMKLVNGKTKGTMKGVKKTFVKKSVSHDQYRSCLFEETESIAKFLSNSKSES